MNIKTIPIGRAEVWEKNPRNIQKDDYTRLKKQIKKLGVYKPLIAVEQNGKYIVLGGNMRLRALRELGHTHVDISIVKADSEARRIEYALSDNDRAGEYDEQRLAEIAYPHLSDFNLEDYKVDIGAAIPLKVVLEEFGPPLDEREDKIPEIDDSPAISERGDLYELGPHRLYCGDAQEESDLEALMGDRMATMVFTDPPWNVAIGLDGNPRHKQRVGLHNDNLDEESYKKFLLRSAEAMKKFVRGDIYCILGASFWPTLDLVMRQAAYHWSATIVWVKDIFVLGRSKYHRRYEPIWYGWPKGRKSSYRADRKQDDVWEFVRPRRSDEHPTMKPVALMERAIKNSSLLGDIVLDQFIGSGSTLISAEKTGRVCYGMDIDPKFVDVTIERYCEYTGELEENVRETKKNDKAKTARGQKKARA